VNVRPIALEDCTGWAAMRAALWPDADLEALAAECADFFRQPAPNLMEAVFVADTTGPGGALAGFVEVSLRSYAEGCRSSPIPFIEGWYVAPGARRSGVGRDLFAAAERWAVEHGYTEIASDADLDNAVSHAAHAALGFEETSRNVHFRKALRQE
jgi:aminoglycoside 6'-N-acetyltransferase I